MTYRLDDVFTAIADPNRRRILDYLAARDMTAGGLAERFDISRPAVARHLRVLRESGLVTVRREGRYRVHGLRPEPLREVRDWIQSYEGFWDEGLRTLKARVENEASEEAGPQMGAETPGREP